MQPSACTAAKGLHPNKRKIETKFKLPLLNWVTIPATQIAGTVFHQLDDETVLRQLDFTEFEEIFKMKTQAGGVFLLDMLAYLL